MPLEKYNRTGIAIDLTKNFKRNPDYKNLKVVYGSFFNHNHNQFDIFILKIDKKVSNHPNNQQLESNHKD